MIAPSLLIFEATFFKIDSDNSGFGYLGYGFLEFYCTCSYSNLLTLSKYFQIISLVIGAIYYGQKNDQDGVINMNGVIFIFLTNMTFQNVFAVINVSTNSVIITTYSINTYSINVP